VQRVGTLHWVLVQAVCLDAVLGRKQNADEGRWETAKFAADLYCAHNSPEERAYAFASLAELYLLRLAGDAADKDHEKLKARALEYIDDLVGMYPFRSEFPVTSTLRQSQRYVDWWGSPRFKEELTGRAPAP
jgi:hypothetical protein